MCQSSDSWRLNLSASQARVNPLQHRVNQPETVLHVWWLETLGVWRSQSARPGRGAFLYQDQDRELPLAERCEGRGELCHPDDDVGRGFLPYRNIAGEVCNLALAKCSFPCLRSNRHP